MAYTTGAAFFNLKTTRPVKTAIIKRKHDLSITRFQSDSSDFDNSRAEISSSSVFSSKKDTVSADFHEEDGSTYLPSFKEILQFMLLMPVAMYGGCGPMVRINEHKPIFSLVSRTQDILLHAVPLLCLGMFNRAHVQTSSVDYSLLTLCCVLALLEVVIVIANFPERTSSKDPNQVKLRLANWTFFAGISLLFSTITILVGVYGFQNTLGSCSEDTFESSERICLLCQDHVNPLCTKCRDVDTCLEC